MIALVNELAPKLPVDDATHQVGVRLAPEKAAAYFHAAFMRGAWWHVGLFVLTVLLAAMFDDRNDLFLLQIIPRFLAIVQAVVVGLWFGGGQTTMLIKLPVLLVCVLTASNVGLKSDAGDASGLLLACALCFAGLSATARLLGLRSVLKLRDGRVIVPASSRQFSIAQIMLFTAAVAVLLATFQSGRVRPPQLPLSDWHNLAWLLPIGCVLALTAWSALSDSSGALGITLTYTFLVMIALGLIISPNAATLPGLAAIVAQIVFVGPLKKYLQRDFVRQGKSWDAIDGLSLFFLVWPTNAVVFGALNPSALLALVVGLLQVGVIVRLWPFRAAGFRLQRLQNICTADKSPDLPDARDDERKSDDEPAESKLN